MSILDRQNKERGQYYSLMQCLLVVIGYILAYVLKDTHLIVTIITSLIYLLLLASNSNSINESKNGLLRKYAERTRERAYYSTSQTPYNVHIHNCMVFEAKKKEETYCDNYIVQYHFDEIVIYKEYMTHFLLPYSYKRIISFSRNNELYSSDIIKGFEDKGYEIYSIFNKYGDNIWNKSTKESYESRIYKIYAEIKIIFVYSLFVIISILPAFILLEKFYISME